ncbi:DUF3006 domain-containing protein [Metabacillus endolithicus]|uniref:DUF3006 domain-containing protein n=1 Tax=Metabacillus endolithicus TaxID=1535204 RepID=A0ABW5BZ03_9BACI|nr:DUF3006 domain-containing protein [Metabacillus endolithicus]UPG65431.1 DUF3006 domain-containing protein [Metabacillus endolithicus]
MKSKVYTIDRFEKDLAVLLSRSDETVQVDVPRNQLPDRIEVGSILEVEFTGDGSVLFANVLEDETSTAKNNAQELLNKLANKNRSGT